MIYRLPRNYSIPLILLLLSFWPAAGVGWAADDFVTARYQPGSLLDTTDPPILTAPAGNSLTNGPVQVTFTLPEAAFAGSVTLTFDGEGAPLVLTLEQETDGEHSFTFDPSDPVASSGGKIVSGVAIPDGTYEVTLSYRDAAGNPAATDVSSHVTIDIARGTPILVSPASDALVGYDVSVSYHLPLAVESLNLTFDDGVTLRVLGLTLTSAGDHTLDFVTAHPSMPLYGGVGSGPPIPDGNYTVTLSYRDETRHVLRSAVSTNVTVDTRFPTINAPDGGFTSTSFMASGAEYVALPDYRSQVTVSDPVGGISITQFPPPGTRLTEGMNRVTLVATNKAGNSDSIFLDATLIITERPPLAVKGEAVPNEDADPRIPDGATWGAFGVPSISTNGTMAGWMATVKAPGQRSFQGLFIGPSAYPAAQLVLRTGDPTPDADGIVMNGVSFKSFHDPVFAGTEYAVLATVQGTGVRSTNETGIWIRDESTVHAIAREGTMAPGTNVRFRSFLSVAMPAPDVVAFVAKVSAPGGKDQGLWMWTPSTGTELAVREGDPVDLNGVPFTVQSFQVLTHVKGSPGHGHYSESSIAVLLILTNGRHALVEALPYGPPHLRAISGSQRGSGGKITRFGVPSSAGPVFPSIVALATLAVNPFQSITEENNVGIYDVEDDEFRTRKGNLAPGAEPAIFKSFLDPVAGRVDTGSVVEAFIATLAGAPRSADSGIWAYHNELKSVALEGGEPPGAAGTRWKAFTSLTVLEGRGPMFTATLASGTTKVKAGNDVGLWATDSTGVLKLIVREGDPVGEKTLRNFDVLGAVAGSPGQRRAWTAGDASARVIYRAFFTDGSSGIVSTAVP